MNKTTCIFCSKEFKSNAGKNGHEPYCKDNPNKLSAWNKGLTKETNSIVEQYTKSSTETKNSIEWKENHHGWNKGLTKETDDRVRKNADAMKITKRSIEHKEKTAENIRNKYGGLHFTQTEPYKENMKSVLMDKYGVDSLMKLPQFVDKILRSRYKFKDYTYPSGKIISVQGYEPFALDYILNIMKLDEGDIITGTGFVPKILYQSDNKIRRYYCDIYLTSINLIVEVKSEYTILCEREINLLKQKTSKLLGYNHEVWLFHSNGTLIERIGDLDEYKYDD